MRISIIGSGNIGGAIARGLAKGTMFKASDITCTAQSDETLEKMRKMSHMHGSSIIRCRSLLKESIDRVLMHTGLAAVLEFRKDLGNVRSQLNF